MRTRHLSVCALLVAGGCAHSHGVAEHHAPQDEQLVTTHEVAKERENPASVERVELPTDKKRNPQLASSGGTLPPVAEPDRGAPVVGTSADNTRLNARDRGNATLTPMDQGESEADRMLVQRIRKAVIADGTLSFTAKNVKIITRDGQVTLRGAVNSAREKDAIEKTAREAAGPTRVTNELEVSN